MNITSEILNKSSIITFKSEELGDIIVNKNKSTITKIDDGDSRDITDHIVKIGKEITEDSKISFGQFLYTVFTSKCVDKELERAENWFDVMVE